MRECERLLLRWWPQLLRGYCTISEQHRTGLILPLRDHENLRDGPSSYKRQYPETHHSGKVGVPLRTVRTADIFWDEIISTAAKLILLSSAKLWTGIGLVIESLSNPRVSHRNVHSLLCFHVAPTSVKASRLSRSRSMPKLWRVSYIQHFVLTVTIEPVLPSMYLKGILAH
jgi:hypothetical protein